LGCCPNFFLEPSYTIDRKRNYADHPPTFLTQPTDDQNAAAYASQQYLEELAYGGGVGFRMVGHTGAQHGLTNCAVSAAAEFLLRALAEEDIPKFAPQ
jgi:hypothetical protein